MILKNGRYGILRLTQLTFRIKLPTHLKSAFVIMTLSSDFRNSFNFGGQSMSSGSNFMNSVSASDGLIVKAITTD